MEAKQENPANPTNINILTKDVDEKSEAGTEICSEFQHSCSCCPTEMTEGICCAEILEKLMAQLKASEKREKELTERAEKADSQLETVKKNEQKLTERTDLYKNNFEQAAYQLHNFLRRTFPLPSHCYTIVTKQAYTDTKLYWYACADGKLELASRPFPCTSKFEIRKNPDGSFSIFSPFLKKFLYVDFEDMSPENLKCRVGFTKARNDSIGCKFEFVFSQSYRGYLTAAIRVLSATHYDTFLNLYNYEDWKDWEFFQEFRPTSEPAFEFLFSLAE